MPTLVNRQREEPTGCDGGRQLSMNGTSRVSREAQARICERLGVRLPGATRPRGETPWAYSPGQVLRIGQNLAFFIARLEVLKQSLKEWGDGHSRCGRDFPGFVHLIAAMKLGMCWHSR